MKGFTYAALASAVLAISSVQGMQSFLKQFPNGSKFAKELGHKGGSDSDFTALGTAFLNSGEAWSTSFCKQMFPNSKITIGQAFGDPCCVWKVGDPAPQSVSAFTTDPGKGTTCATGSSGGGGNSGGNAPAPAPAGGNGGGNAPAPAPAGGNNKPANGGGNNKPANGGGNNNGGGNGGGNNKPKKACKKKKAL